MTFEEAIKDTDARWAEMFNRDDTSALIGLHADEFLLLPPNSPAERGAEAGMAGFQELLDAGWKNIRAPRKIPSALPDRIESGISDA